MKHSIPYIIIGLLISIILWDFFFRVEEAPKVVEYRDTTYVYKTDTITKIKPKYISETKLDSVFIYKTNTDTIYLPMTQRYYLESKMYELWISGVNPKLDSINVYNNTITETIYNTKEIYKTKWSLYANAGVLVMPNKNILPMVDLTANSRGRLSFGVMVGYWDRSVVYGGKIGVKIH